MEILRRGRNIHSIKGIEFNEKPRSSPDLQMILIYIRHRVFPVLVLLHLKLVNTYITLYIHYYQLQTPNNPEIN